MPGTQRRIDPGLIEQLRNEPYRFEFFQAVRILLENFRTHDEPRRDLDVLGQVIQFRNSISLSFPASEIESLCFENFDEHGQGKGNAGRVTLTPSFMGLIGPSGVMPRHYTHYVAEREIFHRDSATRSFLDIFTSRALALFYQAWLKYRLHMQYESDRKNRFSPIVLSLGGLGLSGTQGRLEGSENKEGVADESLAFYVGALRQRPQSAQWFSRIVAEYFNVKCKLEQFIGQWFELPLQERTKLGMANSALGESMICGARVWDRSAKIRLIIGPLRKKQFEDFLPGMRAAKNFRRMFQLLVGTTLDCEVQLILDRRDLTNTCLGKEGSRLGWCGWLGLPAEACDSKEVSYTISEAAHM
jgi:type VI secretion system protein ImpH